MDEAQRQKEAADHYAHRLAECVSERERLRTRLREFAEDVTRYAERPFLVHDADAILAELGEGDR